MDTNQAIIILQTEQQNFQSQTGQINNKIAALQIAIDQLQGVLVTQDNSLKAELDAANATLAAEEAQLNPAPTPLTVDTPTQ